jgi:O-antigen ligase
VSQTRSSEAPLGRVVTDSGYLQVAVQLGLPGLFLFIAMLLSMARDLVWRASAGSPLAAGALGALVALMIAMLGGGYWGLTAPASIFAVVVGLALREAPPSPAAGEAPRRAHALSPQGA